MRHNTETSKSDETNEIDSTVTSPLPYQLWETKDAVQSHTERRRLEVTMSLLQPHRDNIILDVGCCVGYHINYIIRHTSRVIGIDISKTRLIEARERIKEGDLICASSEKLPFQPNIFDKVMCLELLEHLRDPSKTVNEIDFALKEEGVLIVSVPYRERLKMTQCVHCGKSTPASWHLHSFDEYKLSSFLPKNYVPLRREYVATPISAYPFFSFLPFRLWKVIDDLSRLLPYVKAWWLITKFEKSCDGGNSPNLQRLIIR